MKGSSILGIYFGCLFGIPIVLYFLWFLLSILVVRQKETVIVERWGKFHRKLDAGLHFIMPFMDRLRSVEWRELNTNLVEKRQEVYTSQHKWVTRIDSRQTVMDFPLQPIITRDNVEIDVHPMILYELVDATRVAYETYSLAICVERLVQTSLRSIIGDMGLDDTLASREEINRHILQKISPICYNWGLKICRVELLEIHPTHSVQEAMHKQLSAERSRRAVIVTADGYREKVKTEAEGNCQAAIALASGEQQCNVIAARAKADAKVVIAKAEADAIKVIGKALEGLQVDTTQYIVGLKYIETFLQIAQNATERELVLPYDMNIIGATSEISS